MSLTDSDLSYLDEQTRLGRYPSRSAALKAAIAELRSRDRSDDYAEAWREWTDGDGPLWDAVGAEGWA